MAKFLPNAVLDLIPAFIANGTRISVCSAQPDNFAGIAAVSLADVVVTPGDGNGDFTIQDGDYGGRKVSISQQPDVPVDASGTASHIVIDDGSVLLAVTTCVGIALSSGGTTNIPEFDFIVGLEEVRLRYDLVVQEQSVGITMDSPTLVQHGVLTVQDMAVGIPVDNITLGGVQLEGFVSNWDTQLADQGHVSGTEAADRCMDVIASVARWTSRSASSDLHFEVETAASELPFDKWLDMEHQNNGRAGWCQLFKTGLTALGIGDVLSYGWTEQYILSNDMNATNHQHGIGCIDDGWEFCDSFDVSDDDLWVFFFWWHGNADPNNKWSIWEGDGTETGDNNFEGQIRLEKAIRYEFQFQVHRIGSTTCNIYAWIYNADTRELLYGPEDFFNQDGDVSLDDLPTLTLNPDDFTTFCFGSNGVNGTGGGGLFDVPLPHKKLGAVRIGHNQVSAGSPLPVYGSFEGET